MAQRLNDATMRTPEANGETIGRDETVGNSDWKQLGQIAERKEWGGTVRPVARKGQGVSDSGRTAGPTDSVQSAELRVQSEKCRTDCLRVAAFGTLQFALVTLH